MRGTNTSAPVTPDHYSSTLSCSNPYLFPISPVTNPPCFLPSTSTLHFRRTICTQRFFAYSCAYFDRVRTSPLCVSEQLGSPVGRCVERNGMQRPNYAGAPGGPLGSFRLFCTRVLALRGISEGVESTMIARGWVFTGFVGLCCCLFRS